METTGSNGALDVSDEPQPVHSYDVNGVSIWTICLGLLDLICLRKMDRFAHHS
jgi:hypothetical protein